MLRDVWITVPHQKYQRNTTQSIACHGTSSGPSSGSISRISRISSNKQQPLHHWLCQGTSPCCSPQSLCDSQAMEEMDQCHHQSGWSGPWNTCLKSIFQKVFTLEFNTKVNTRTGICFGKVPFLHAFLWTLQKLNEAGWWWSLYHSLIFIYTYLYLSKSLISGPGSPDVPMLARRFWCLKTKKCRPSGQINRSSKSIMNLEDQKPHAILGATIADKLHATEIVSRLETWTKLTMTTNRAVSKSRTQRILRKWLIL